MIRTLEDALTHLATEGEMHSLTSREHPLVRQAQLILDGEVDVPRS